MSFDLKKRYNLLFRLFFVFSLLFPAVIINKFFFLIILAFMLINYETLRMATLSPFIVFSIFLFGFLLSFFSDVDRGLSIQFFLSILVLFLIYPMWQYKIDIEHIAKLSGLIMALYTGISFLMIVVFIGSPFSEVCSNIFTNYSSGSNGLREFAEEGTISFHIGTVPFLYLSFVLYVISFVEKKKISALFVLIILFTTVIISASRGLILSCILAAGFIIFFKSNFKSKIIFLAITIPIILISMSYLLSNTNVFSSSEDSNSVKIGHMESFFDNINFINFFMGDGLASYYYSKGSQSMKAHTEITPLDMLRYFGFILTPILYLVIVFPVSKLKAYLGENILYVVLFLIYVINSFTNPTMFNSYGLLIVLWYWYKILDVPSVNFVKSF